MDIREAKEQIARCVRIYLKKDSYGNYRIPVERQRPVFLLGAPGIGKTAIMEQISRETGLPLLSYSMTHHTRQSALGLPVIVDRSYQGKTYSVSEYTLSEIISSIYACMERTGVKEGFPSRKGHAGNERIRLNPGKKFVNGHRNAASRVGVRLGIVAAAAVVGAPLGEDHKTHPRSVGNRFRLDTRDENRISGCA